MKMKLVALCGFMLICQTSSAGTSKVSLTASVDYSGGIAVEFNMGSVIFTAIFKPLTSCGWSISETQTPIPAQTQAIFFNRTCRPNTTDFTCSSHTYPLLVSTLRWPNILHTDVDVSFSCGTTEPIQTINIKAKYCSTSHHLQVHSSMNEVLINGTYGTTGNFACSNNGTLVYSNGLTPSLFSTTCQANAKWQGQNELQCVLVELNGKNNYTLKSSNKGDTDFSCSVSGNISALTNSNLTLQVGNEAKLPNFQIQPIDHGKEVRCLLSWQSTNTKIPSESKTLIVNFPTQIRNISVNRDTSKGKHLVQSNQTISLYCSTSANPPATCQWKIPEKNISSNLSLNTTDPKNCNVTVVISKSGFVFCFAKNNIGPVANKSVEFVSVPVERVPQIKINSSLVDSSNSIYYNKTQSIRLMCSVDNSQDLNTTYKWEKNGTLMGPFMTLDLDNLMPNNSGNYTCKTDDMFGSYVSEIRIEVQYPPDLQNESIKCSVNITCTITVLANPNVSYASISQSGGIIKEYTTGPKFQFTPNTTGNYTMFANNSIGESYFSFEVGSALFETPAGNQALIIGASVAGGLLIVVVVVLVIVLYRRKKNHKDEKEVRENPLYGSAQNTGGNGAVDPEANKKKKKTKEMKVNVAYQPASPDVIEDAYGGVNTGEREMKDNILYGSSGPSAQPMEDAYAEVNKGKKNKKGKKEMKVNVAYVPTPENPDAPEEAYAAVDKTKKNKGKKQKPEKEMKDNILYATSQAGGSMDDAYAQVDKGKKKAGNSYGESSQGATYSEVNKPKKKNKQPPPPTSPTQDDDPYAEVDLHGQDMDAPGPMKYRSVMEKVKQLNYVLNPSDLHSSV